MLSIAVLFLIQGAPAPAVAPDDSGDPPGRVARLSLLEGNVLFQPSGDTAPGSWSDASINYVLSSGDRLYAERGGRAELQVGDATLRINGVADLTVATLSDDFLQVSLAAGTLRVSVYDLSGGDSIEIDTPNGALMLRQAGAYRIAVSPGEPRTDVAVDSGVVDVVTGEAAQQVARGQALELTGTAPIRVASVAYPEADDFDRWSAERDGSLASSESAQYVGRDVPGYDDLDHAGRWEQEADYGPVWYPTVVVVGWTPYRFGHWVWIDPWGWTWVDDYPWGYAPFHYGRWVHLHDRWGWVPGPRRRHPCYAPALVVFVSVGRVGVQAWVPLGPREPYHPWYHHGPRYRDRVNPGITVMPAHDVRYVNRPQLTAVPLGIFQGGEAVGRRTVRVSASDADRASVIPHPRVNPSTRAAVGRPARKPPVVPRPNIEVTPWRSPPATVPAPRPTERPVPRPARPTPPVRRVPPVIAKNPPAPQALPFPTRRKAMQSDPGRPLEPQQRQNIREGKPAGPHRDREEPPDRRAPPPKKKP